MRMRMFWVRIRMRIRMFIGHIQIILVVMFFCIRQLVWCWRPGPDPGVANTTGLVMLLGIYNMQIKLFHSMKYRLL